MGGIATASKTDLERPIEAIPERNIMDLRSYQSKANDYDQLSLKDLLEARDLYHIHLMRHPHVVATAIGRYRIRKGDSWPDGHGYGKIHGKGERTLENSEVRPYSWPAILVFVDDWVPATEFGKDGRYNPDDFVPKTLYLPDGRRVPICVISAPRELNSPPTPEITFPLNNIGGGRPILAQVQGQEHVATIACLVRDGHKTYALTNRHVTGEAGEVAYTRRQGKTERVGSTASKQLTRIKFTDLYPGFQGNDVFVNLDIGMIDIDNLDDWSAKIEGIGTMGPMIDVSVHNLSLALIGCQVRGYGSASGLLLGEIHALFYRYKTRGGSDYVADLFIGPRSTPQAESKAKRKSADDDQPAFATLPGDSGTLYLLEPQVDHKQKGIAKPEYLPLAMQWGSHLLGGGGQKPQPYALATCLSTVCDLLDVDLVRDWNLDQPDTWGAIGHFSIATSVIGAMSKRQPKLDALMKQNASLIAPDDGTIRSNDFKGMGSAANVPLADVPDFFWKPRIAKQGYARQTEGPNHFADMDQPNAQGQTLLSLCKDETNIDPDIWNTFYDSVRDLLDGTPITQGHRGLLPFRVWQIFDEMVKFAHAGKAAEFVCAAGVLTHYIGDACQPLHVSYLHDGDPKRPTTRTVHRQKTKNHEAGDEVVTESLGKGVHTGYEDDMVNAHRDEILTALAQTPKVGKQEVWIKDGFEAAKQTIELMRSVFTLLPPAKIVQAFIDAKGQPESTADILWARFGKNTKQAMQLGTHLLALLWESAWAQGQGETKVKNVNVQIKPMDICANPDFLKSYTIDQIGAVLKHPVP
jgi:hypothetical protein